MVETRGIAHSSAGADYRPDVDGLRAVAVGAVLAYHAGAADSHILPGGYLGVDVFFVISGFVITRRLLRLDTTQSGWLRGFMTARLRRLVPALAVTLAASIPAVFLLMWPEQVETFSQSALAAVLFVSNLFFYAQDPYEAASNAFSPLIHTWSLGVEFQFYLVYPLLFAAAFLRSRRALFGVVAALALLSLIGAEIMVRHDKSAAFFLPFTRFWEFGAGALIAALPRPTHQAARLASAASAAALAVLLWTFLAFDGEMRHPGLVTLIPVAATCVLIAAGAPENLVTRGLALPPLLGIGVISYSLYLVHQPLLAFARLAQPTPLTAVQVASLVAASVPLAYLSWRFVEQPFRRPRAGVRSGLRLPVVAGALMLAALGVGAATGLSMSRFSTAAFDYMPKRGMAESNGKLCDLNTVRDACLVGDATVAPTIALLGDSHMATLSGPIGEMLKRHGQSALMMVMVGCPFIEGVLRFTYPRDCQGHAVEAFEAMARRGIRTAIVHDYRNAYLTGMTGERLEPRSVEVYSVEAGKESPTRLDDVLKLQASTFRHLLASVPHVIFIAPVPDAPAPVPAAVRAAARANRLPYTFDVAFYLSRSQVLFDALKGFADEPGFSVLYPHSVLCPAGLCRTHSATRLYYTDSNHLSEDGGALVAAALEPLLGD